EPGLPAPLLLGLPVPQEPAAVEPESHEEPIPPQQWLVTLPLFDALQWSILPRTEHSLPVILAAAVPERPAGPPVARELGQTGLQRVTPSQQRLITHPLFDALQSSMPTERSLPVILTAALPEMPGVPPVARELGQTGLQKLEPSQSTRVQGTWVETL